MVLANTDYVLKLFSSSPGRVINPKLVNLLEEFPARVSISRFSPKYPWLTYLIDLIPGLSSRRKMLQKCVDEQKFDAIHFFEMQHSGYLLQSLKELPRTKIIYSNYGSDIFWYQKFAKHVRRMQRILSATDLVFYECSRDLIFIKAAAKKGLVTVRTVNSGGLRPLTPTYKPSARSTILVKGYSNRWGKGIWTLLQMSKLTSMLRSFEVVVYSCDPHVVPLAHLWGLVSRVTIRTHIKGSLSHDETLALFEDSIAHVAMSKSDGIPSSTLEAMRGGAIPIQSNSACMERFIQNGINGFLIPINGSELRKALVTILQDVAFTQKARVENMKLISEVHSEETIAKEAIAGYEAIFETKA